MLLFCEPQQHGRRWSSFGSPRTGPWAAGRMACSSGWRPWWRPRGRPPGPYRGRGAPRTYGDVFRLADPVTRRRPERAA